MHEHSHTHDIQTIDAQHAITTLDGFYEVAQSGLLSSAVLATIQATEQWRRTAHADWSGFVKSVCQPHPMTSLLQQCPMTQRAVDKPRGYAGDAVMLDYIYDREHVFASTDHQAHQANTVFRTVVNTPTCGSVDYRRQLIAKKIDELANASHKPIRVLSLACGHAREFDLCKTLRTGQIEEIVALDQDVESLQTIAQRYPNSPIHAQQLSVRDLLMGKKLNAELGTFDFVYSAGLYDYLDQRLATRLTAKLFEFLRPNGQLLLANFHTNNHGTGFMEAFMDWWLIYRTDEQMLAVANDIDPGQVKAKRQYQDPFGNVTYLEVGRAGL